MAAGNHHLVSEHLIFGIHMMKSSTKTTFTRVFFEEDPGDKHTPACPQEGLQAALSPLFPAS